MKKQMMTVLAVSAMMTLAMPFASFAAARSCQTGLRPGNNCGYTGATAVSMIRMQSGCMISNGNAIDLCTLSGKGYPDGAGGNSCGADCANGSVGIRCSYGTGCGFDFCAAGNCSTNIILLTIMPRLGT